MKIRLLIIISFFYATASAQVSEYFPVIEAESLKNGSVKSEKTYTAESLFGYMNGGAELYLEYGFDRLVVTELEYKETEYRAEIYKMKDAEAAYGIYSVSVFRCDSTGVVNDYSCLSPYQLQFCKGSYYISLVNSSGSSETAAGGIELAGMIASSITETSFKLNDIFRTNDIIQKADKILLVKGDLGMNNGAFRYADLLEGMEDYVCLIAESETRAVLRLDFETENSKSAFLDKFSIPGTPSDDESVHNIDDNTTLKHTDDGSLIIKRSF